MLHTRLVILVILASIYVSNVLAAKNRAADSVVDVVVVGAGYSGLIAALNLTRSVVVTTPPHHEINAAQLCLQTLSACNA